MCTQIRMETQATCTRQICQYDSKGYVHQADLSLLFTYGEVGGVRVLNVSSLCLASDLCLNCVILLLCDFI